MRPTWVSLSKMVRNAAEVGWDGYHLRIQCKTFIRDNTLRTLLASFLVQVFEGDSPLAYAYHEPMQNAGPGEETKVLRVSFAWIFNTMLLGLPLLIIFPTAIPAASSRYLYIFGRWPKGLLQEVLQESRRISSTIVAIWCVGIYARGSKLRSILARGCVRMASLFRNGCRSANTQCYRWAQRQDG